MIALFASTRIISMGFGPRLLEYCDGVSFSILLESIPTDVISPGSGSIDGSKELIFVI